MTVRRARRAPLGALGGPAALVSVVLLLSGCVNAGSAESSPREATVPTAIATIPDVTVTPLTPSYVAPDRPREALMGVGAADPYDWGTWLGRAVGINEAWDYVRDWQGLVTWAVMDQFQPLSTPYINGPWTGTVSLAQPMYADNETVRTCASTAEITTWAEDLKAALPTGTVFIRLGWEFNGDWYHWSVKPGDSGAFKACWIKWYGLVKAASSRFDLVWNPTARTSTSGVDVRAYWPGAAYVDAAGPDSYALSAGGQPLSPTRTGPLGEPVGVDAWLEWVGSKGIPFAVPEWAIRNEPGGSASPVYIDQMRAAFVAAAQSPSGLAYETYFDGGLIYNCRLSIHAPGCPEAPKQAAVDEYKKLWIVPYP